MAAFLNVAVQFFVCCSAAFGQNEVRTAEKRMLQCNFCGAAFRKLGLAPLQKIVGDFCCIKFGGFCRGFSWRIFLGTFAHKNEEKKSGDKIRDKIRRLKNKNPLEIRSAKKPALRKLQRNFRSHLWHVAGVGFRGVGFRTC